MGEPSNTHETNLAKVPHGGGGGGGGHREPPDSQLALNTHQRFERFNSVSQPDVGLMIK